MESLISIISHYFLRAGLIDLVLRILMLIAFGRAIYISFHKPVSAYDALTHAWLIALAIGFYDLYWLPGCLMSTYTCLIEIQRAITTNFFMALSLTTIILFKLAISEQDKKLRHRHVYFSILGLLSVIMIAILFHINTSGIDKLLTEKYPNEINRPNR